MLITVSSFKKIEEIKAWIKARELTREIYQITNQKPFANDYALRDQIRKTCISIMSNIAEGFERDKPNEFAYFLRIAKGSAGEVRAQLYIALDQNYIDDEIFNRLHSLASEIAQMLKGLINYLVNNEVEG